MLKAFVTTFLSASIIYIAISLWNYNEKRKKEGKVYYNFLIVFVLLLGACFTSECFVSLFNKNLDDDNAFLLVILLTIVFMYIFMKMYKKNQENKIKATKKKEK